MRHFYKRFKSYIQTYNLARAEGILLRYLSEAYRCLDRTLPLDKRDDQLKDIISWLGLVVRSVDSSLVDEWANTGSMPEEPGALVLENVVVHDRRALTVLVRNALFSRVRLVAKDDAKALGALDSDWSFGELKWKHVLDAYYESHEEVLLDADARSATYFHVDENDEKEKHVWHVHQVLSDPEGDHDFGIMADVDLDATQEEGNVVFTNYRAGSIEELLGK